VTASNEESFNIIKRMASHPPFFDNWKTIRDKYRANLNSGAYQQDKKFTPHDYDKHCVNIYNILDSILLRGLVPDDDINEEHLFILNVAVILHDIYMAFNPEVRDSHSLHAKDFVIKQQQEYQLPIDPDQAKCIGEVILGHSDLKDQGVNTIDLLPEKDNSLNGVMGKKINVRLLSALLRLADELDENSRRIYNVDPRLYGIVQGDDSWKHWRKCELLRFPTLNGDDDRIINLNVNSELIRVSGIYPTDYKILTNVKNKISGELKQLNDKVLCKRNGLKGWRVDKIEFCADPDIMELLQKSEEDFKEPATLPLEPIATVDPLATSGPGVKSISAEQLKVSDSEFETKLTKYVLENNYLKSGHYYVDTEGACCARDWIDTDHLLQDEAIRDEIISRFISQIAGHNYNILGIGHNGLLLASILAFQTSNPYSYIVLSGHKKFNVAPDRNISINNKFKTVLVTDVVVSGNTLKDAISELQSEYSVNSDDIVNIFSVFYRKPIYSDEPFNMPFVDKLFSLDNQLDIEICKKPQCHFCVFKDNEINLYSNKPKVL
jgi:orotate phosphoribosyltransferase